MTRAEVRAMPAGREMDALVAERVMGWRRLADGWFVTPGEEAWPTNPTDLPAYSTDIAAACWREYLGTHRGGRGDDEEA